MLSYLSNQPTTYEWTELPYVQLVLYLLLHDSVQYYEIPTIKPAHKQTLGKNNYCRMKWNLNDSFSRRTSLDPHKFRSNKIK